MFSEIISGHPQIICLLDTAVDSGRFLIKELISDSSATNFHVLCFDHEIDGFQKELKDTKKTINFHDCLPILSPNPETNDDMDVFVKSMEGVSEPQCIVLDSVSTLFLQKPACIVYRHLRQLLHYGATRYSKSRTVFVVHEDTLPNPKSIIAQMKLLCNMWIRIQAPRINVTIHKGIGKTSTVTYKYSYSDEKIVWQKEEHVEELSKPTPNEGPVSTFKLTLSESEKKARDAVKLPYERHDTDTEPGSSAAIIYEPDEFDDWDEEDPDNDLEFS